jgi:hypothetical protein
MPPGLDLADANCSLVLDAQAVLDSRASYMAHHLHCNTTSPQRT